MVLAQKQTGGLMERNSIPRNKLTNIKPTGFDKGYQSLHWEKENLFSKWCWKNWISTCRKMNLKLYLSLLKKLNSKWIKDLNLRPQTIKLLPENTGETLGDIEVGKDF